MDIKIAFLGTPGFVQPIKLVLSKHFKLVNSLKKADLGVVASYGRILTEGELGTPESGCINIHPSLLPEYRGPTPIQQAILNGDQISGITIIKMDQEIDHGPVIYQESLDLSSSDNFHTLSKKMFLRAAAILPQVIKDFVSGKIKLVEQNHNLASFCERLTKKHGHFPLSNPPVPEKLDKMIRAYFPWPGVWTRWRGKIVKFLPEGLVQMEGKRPVSFEEFSRGYPDFPIKTFNKDIGDCKTF